MKYDKRILDWINDILHNDEVSTDEELVDHFVKEGLTEAEAKRFVTQRDRCVGWNSSGHSRSAVKMLHDSLWYRAT